MSNPPRPEDTVTRDHFVWSMEHYAWWGANRCGYYTTLAYAGRYTKAEADEIVAGSRGKDECAVPVAEKVAELRDYRDRLNAHLSALSASSLPPIFTPAQPAEEIDRAKQLRMIADGLVAKGYAVSIGGWVSRLRIAADQLDRQRADLLRLSSMTKNIRHCDECGADWYDGGLNAPECPWCKIQRLASEHERLKVAMKKIDDIRNDIIGRQTLGWSAHVYPLVVALGDAGFEGLGYEQARKRITAKEQQLDTETREAFRGWVDGETREGTRT